MCRSRSLRRAADGQDAVVDEADKSSCDYCGDPIGDAGWIGLAVLRPRPEDLIASEQLDVVDLEFCSRPHAALYLHEDRLPPVASAPVPEPLTTWERAQGWLIGAAVVAVIVWSLFIFGLGAWTFVRHLRGT
jgi:hypothetical protein